jgi:predicted transcriptional regulator
VDRLREWLANAAGEILPRRPQRKIKPDRLEEFLCHTQSSWFRVQDLAQAFDIDRKTAWEYLQKFQDAGLLVHNRGRSAAVRYRLADDFLKVRMAAVQQQVAQALAGLPRPLSEQVSAWLAATAGEPFWEEDWPPRMGTGCREEIVSSLKAAKLLETLLQSGQNQLLRLQRRWLRSPEE